MDFFSPLKKALFGDCMFRTSSTNSQAFDGHYAAWCESDQHGTFDEVSGHPVDVVFF